jgi:hypothetical protein
MSYDKSVLKKEQKGLLKCALDQRGPSNVPKEKNCPQKKMGPKNLQINSLKCAQTKNGIEKIQKESL